MKKIGITGNIACGKSISYEIIKTEGYPIIDCDDIVKSFYNNNIFISEMAKEFPQIIIHNKIDLKILSELIFSDKNFKDDFEKFIFPKVREEIIDFFEKCRVRRLTHLPFDKIFVIVPLLFEAGFEDLFDKIIFISSDENIRKERLISRNSMLSDMADNVIKLQMKEEEKIPKCDYVIKNNTTIEDFNCSIKKLIYLNF